MQRYVIQLGDRDLYAACGPDWAPLTHPAVAVFDDRHAAEVYRRVYCHEGEARVVRVWLQRPEQ